MINPEILAFLDDAVCYVDDALHHQPADEERVNQALAGLKQRMQQLEPRADSKEPLVVQQVGLLIALLPEIGRLQRQIDLHDEVVDQFIPGGKPGRFHYGSGVGNGALSSAAAHSAVGRSTRSIVIPSYSMVLPSRSTSYSSRFTVTLVRSSDINVN